MLLALLPLILIVALLVRVDSPGPAFFQVDRSAAAAATLRMLKFRKMHDDAVGIALTTTRTTGCTGSARSSPSQARRAAAALAHPARRHELRRPPARDAPTSSPTTAHEYDEILSVRPGLVGFPQIAFLSEGRILNEEDPLTHYVERDPPAEGHARPHVRPRAHAPHGPEDPRVVDGRRAGAPPGRRQPADRADEPAPALTGGEQLDEPARGPLRAELLLDDRACGVSPRRRVGLGQRADERVTQPVDVARLREEAVRPSSISSGTPDW